MSGRPGRWIAFEGGEGTGKSTQSRLLADRLVAVATREPGGTAIGAQVRSLLLDPGAVGLDDRAEALLMAADRAQHVAEVVAPALAAGRDVVSDRSAYSSLAYQGYGRGLAVDEIRALCGWATCDRWPDLVVLLDVPPAVAADRLAARSSGPAADRLEAAGAAFHARVTAGFLALAEGDSERWVVIDGTGTTSAVADRVNVAYDGWASPTGGPHGDDDDRDDGNG